MKLTAPQALRIAEEQQRVYVSHILAALLVADSASKLDSYKLVLGDIAARMEVAESLSRLACDLEAQERSAEGPERSDPQDLSET